MSASTPVLQWARMKKPPITIKCECGETQDVAYGQRWLCDVCQRSWNTQQIPQEEYDGVLRRVRRHQLGGPAGAGLMAALFVALIVVVSSGFIYLIPIVMVFWFFVLLPFWRRRYRRTARSAPRW